jgi:hypothetical protein
MLRINLLPAYIAQRKRVTNTIIGMVALFLIVNGLMLGYNFAVLGPAVTAKEEEANAMQAKADAVVAYEAETTQIRAKVKPLQEKVQFVELVRYHNGIRQKIFRNVARYTYKNVEYDSMAVSGSTLSLRGYVAQLSDIGRFYITLFGNPDVTAVSLTSSLPSWPSGATNQQAQAVNTTTGPIKPAYQVAATATLVRPVVTPTLPASALTPPNGAPAGAAVPGAPTAPPVSAPPSAPEDGEAP